MPRKILLKAILSAQLIQGMSFAGADIPNLPPKEKEELDGSETESKRRKAGDDEEKDDLSSGSSTEDEYTLALELRGYIERGDVKNARNLLETHIDDVQTILMAMHDDVHPMAVAAYKGNEAAIALLLELAETNDRLAPRLIPDQRDNPDRRTLLHDAVENGHYGVVRRLLASPFADLFYQFEENLMRLPWYNLNALNENAIADRIFLRRLIIQYRPSFAQVEVAWADNAVPVEVAFMDADIGRLRALLLQGVRVNIRMIDALFFKLRRMKTADEFHAFYMNQVEFMSEFKILKKEIEDGSFYEAMIAAHPQNFPVNELQEQFRRVERTIADIDAYWYNAATRYRTAQIHIFNQETALAVTHVLAAILLRKVK